MSLDEVREDWWREVTDFGEVILAGCPRRVETPSVVDPGTIIVQEVVRDYSVTRGTWSRKSRVFVDKRWREPVKIGMVIQGKHFQDLPRDAVLVDRDGDAWQIVDTVRGQYEWSCGRSYYRRYSNELENFAPLVLVWSRELAEEID